jgi:hypothetical protein
MDSIERLLGSPYTTELGNSLYDMKSNEKRDIFCKLVLNFKNTFLTGTSIYTLHSLTYMIHILQSLFRNEGDSAQNILLLGSFVSLCQDYVSFAQSEGIHRWSDGDKESGPRYTLVGHEKLEYLNAHGDILPLAMEYGFEEIVSKGGNIPSFLQSQLNDINLRYF